MSLMNACKTAWCFVLVMVMAVILVTSTQAQDSTMSSLSGFGAPTSASSAVSDAGVSGASGASSQTSIFSLLGLGPAGKAHIKSTFCKSPFSSLAANASAPLSGISGGLLSLDCCPKPTAAELAQMGATPGSPPTGAQSLAAAVQADQAQAEARIEALEYLSTVDCRYWPEASDVFRDSLRADKVECVRFAAAKALGSGCCCNKVTIEALKIVVSGSDTDGNPPESSERVRAAAFYALNHCLARYGLLTPDPEEAPAPPAGEEDFAPGISRTSFGSVASYYEYVARFKPLSQVITEAQLALSDPTNHPLAGRMLPTGHQSIYHAVVKATTPDPVALASAIQEQRAASRPKNERSQSRVRQVSFNPSSSARPGVNSPVRNASVRDNTVPTGQRSLFGVIRWASAKRASHR